MYFPYLRGKQYELLALRELVELGFISKDVIKPIIEPIKETPTFKKTIDLFVENEFDVFVVMNPQVGEYDKYDEVHPIFGAECPVNDALIVTQSELPPERIFSALHKSTSLIAIYPKKDTLKGDEYLKELDIRPIISFIPEGSRNKRGFKRDMNFGLINDAFKKADRNADYGKINEQYFSEDHLFYKEDGYIGFMDYSIIGSDYVNGGFAPLAVAIHIVYFDEDDVLKIKHFVSDSNDDISNPAGKFNEALTKLIAWKQNINPKNESFALNYFSELNDQRRYPGLGVVKKLAIMHHLEIMNRFLVNNLDEESL